MNAQDFARLRSARADCPSDLALDRLHAGELPSAESQRLTAHIAGCSLCPERLAMRQAGFDALPEVDARPILSTIRRRLHESEQVPAPRRWLRQLGLLLAPMAAATAALAVLLVIRKAPEQRPESLPTATEPGPDVVDVVRAKGGLGLHVYRQAKSDGPTEAGGQATVSGERFAPGDRLRFVVDLPSSGQVTIVGIEATGELYVAWPSPGSTAEPTLRPAGKGQELPGAVALDSSQGRETLYLVHCPQASAPPQCTSQGAQARPQCGTGCAMVSFVINKEP